MRNRLLAFSLVAGCLPAQAWSQVPLGPAFRVNAYTTDSQRSPDIAVHPDGGFVVVWQSLEQDGSSAGVFARLHDETGTPLGGHEFRVNATTQSAQSDPVVAALPGGSFVVAWTSGQDGEVGVFGRRFGADGLPGPEFAVNTYTTGAQYRPVVAAGSNGQFVVVWGSEGQDGSGQGIFGQRYDAAAAPLGGEFHVNTYTTGFQTVASVAMGADGRFVVVWAHRASGIDQEIHGQRYDATGAPVGGEFRVNGDTTLIQAGPSVAMAHDGGFVVAWSRYGTSILEKGRVFGRRFSASGDPLGGDFLVSTTTTGNQFGPRVATAAGGHFVVAWFMNEPEPNAIGRRFDPEGQPETPEFPVGPASLAPVSIDGAGDFVTTWTEEGDAGHDVFARRFRPDVIFRDGFESAGLGAWSATATDGGDLSPSILAAMKDTTVGLRGLVDDTAGLFVQDDSPNDERQYFARFHFDPNGFDPGEALNHFRTRIFIAFSEAPTRRAAAIVLRRQSGLYSIRARVRLDDDTQFDTPFVPIDDGPHAIELQLLASSGPDANGGRLFLFIDGNFVGGGFGLDNSLAEVDFARMGALSLKPGASGTLYWDEFESRRQSLIGP